MAASQTDKFKKVGAGTVTTLAAPGKALAASSINVGSTTNYPTDTGIVIAIRQVDTNGELVAGTYTEWDAVVSSATSLSISTTPRLGSDQVYPAGSTTQVFIVVSSSAHNDLIDGILEEHYQDGTHAAITATSVNVSGIITTDTVAEKTAANGVTIDGLNVKDGKLTTAESVSAINLNTTAGDLGGAWQSWTPTLSGRLNNTKWNKDCKYIQVGKTVHFRVYLVANTTTPMDGGAADAVFTLPVTSVSVTAQVPTIGQAGFLDAGTARYTGFVEYNSTTTARVRYVDSGAVTASGGDNVLTSTTPFTWTTSDEIYCQGTYEAA